MPIPRRHASRGVTPFMPLATVRVLRQLRLVSDVAKVRYSHLAPFEATTSQTPRRAGNLWPNQNAQCVELLCAVWLLPLSMVRYTQKGATKFKLT